MFLIIIRRSRQKHKERSDTLTPILDKRNVATTIIKVIKKTEINTSQNFLLLLGYCSSKYPRSVRKVALSKLSLTLRYFKSMKHGLYKNIINTLFLLLRDRTKTLDSWQERNIVEILSRQIDSRVTSHLLEIGFGDSVNNYTKQYIRKSLELTVKTSHSPELKKFRKYYILEKGGM